MEAICYSGPISAVPTNKQILGEKGMCAKFQIDISKTAGLVHVLYTDRQTNRRADGKGYIKLVTLIIYIYIYFIGPHLIYPVEGIW